MPRKPPAPAGLSSGGLKLWRAVLAAHDLQCHDLRILEDSCHEVDLIDRLSRELADSPSMVKGSMGQLVASPLVSEVRQHRATLNTLLRGLKLPADDSGAVNEARERTEKALTAARAKWNTRKGGAA